MSILLIYLRHFWTYSSMVKISVEYLNAQSLKSQESWNVGGLITSPALPAPRMLSGRSQISSPCASCAKRVATLLVPEASVVAWATLVLLICTAKCPRLLYAVVIGQVMCMEPVSIVAITDGAHCSMSTPISSLVEHSPKEHKYSPRGVPYWLFWVVFRHYQPAGKAVAHNQDLILRHFKVIGFLNIPVE